MLGWISWSQFSFCYVYSLGVTYFAKSFFGAVTYCSDGYFCDITSPVICRTNVHKLQKFTSTYGYDPFVAVDQQYLYFSVFMLYYTMSYLFSSNVQWQVYVTQIRQHYEAILRSPVHLLSSASPLWPPDGFIMAILVLFLF